MKNLTQAQRNELALLYLELERDKRDYAKAKAKYPKADPFWIVADLKHTIVLRKDAIAKIYKELEKSETKKDSQ